MPRKLAFTGGYKVGLVEYDERPLAPHEVRVQTEYASGKHGTPLAIMDGRSERGQIWDEEMRLFLPEEGADGRYDLSGAPVGTSGVGTIIELGSEVSDWKMGDQVISFMDVSETNTIPTRRKLPWDGPPLWLDGCIWPLDDIDPLDALCFEPAFVSFHCIRESNLRFADTVAVVGLGAIGLLTVRMAALSGAEQVFAVDPLPKRRELALDYGAHYALDPFEVDAALEIHKLTGGPGVDVAVELSATYAGLQNAIRATRMEGTICASGVYLGEGRDLWLGREFHRNRLTMIVPHGCFLGHKPRDYSRWDDYRAYDAIISMMRQGALTAPGLIQPLVSLDEGPAVWDLVVKEPGEVVKFGVRF
ncbi:MAG: zinc-binding alcohol dehydrogenase [Chloroflexi bacterium]|nr:zinc-binding alcohol dehydrogenase [Chloroflexota bacterium]